MKTKICTKCKEEKELINFHKNPDGKFGRRNVCKICYLIKQIEIYEINPKKKQKYYLDNKSYINLKHKKYYEINKETLLEYAQIYYDKNHKIIIQKNILYRNNQRKNNIKLRIRDNLISRLYKALKGGNKSLSTMILIGCEIDYLMYHIQEQFTKGMSWDNYGRTGWHIDHKLPCAKFDLSKESDQLECFNYKNLQPLWQIDNLQKGCKYEY